MTVTAHPIDTQLASEWSLIGFPVVVARTVFVQRSGMRGRPWLRFSRKLEAEGYWTSAYPTKRAAVAG